MYLIFTATQDITEGKMSFECGGQNNHGISKQSNHIDVDAVRIISIFLGSNFTFCFQLSPGFCYQI